MSSSPFRLLLTSASGWDPKHDEWGRGALNKLKQSAAVNNSSRFVLANTPEEADAILFCECRDQGPFLEFVRQNAIYRQFSHKCLIYDPGDIPIPIMPGLFPSLIKGTFPSTWAESACYMHVDNPKFEAKPLDLDTAYLFSFTGTIQNNPVRQKLLPFNTPKTPIIDVANATVTAAINNDGKELARLKNLFAETAEKTAFMLCPAGIGSGSFRLFEAMQCARVPVILSDKWVEVPGPDWGGFAIRIAEADVDKLPEILQARRKDAMEMGLYARSEWERYFAPQTLFATIAEQCERLMQSRQQSRREAASALRKYLLDKPMILHYLRTRKQLWKDQHMIRFW